VVAGFGNNGELGRLIIDPGLGEPFDSASTALYAREEPEIMVVDILRQFLTPQPVLLPRTTVLSLACGSNFTLMVARDPATGTGLVYSCGNNSFGQLGDGTTVTPLDLARDPALEVHVQRFLPRPVRLL
jgi:hypothetical protein